MKYSKTVRPSRKLERIGSSMIRPEGATINPRIAAICATCTMLPLAPELVIMCSEPYGSSVLESSLVTASVVWVQIVTAWL